MKTKGAFFLVFCLLSETLEAQELQKSGKLEDLFRLVRTIELPDRPLMRDILQGAVSNDQRFLFVSFTGNLFYHFNEQDSKLLEIRPSAISPDSPDFAKNATFTSNGDIVLDIITQLLVVDRKFKLKAHLKVFSSDVAPILLGFDTLIARYGGSYSRPKDPLYHIEYSDFAGTNVFRKTAYTYGIGNDYTTATLSTDFARYFVLAPRVNALPLVYKLRSGEVVKTQLKRPTFYIGPDTTLPREFDTPDLEKKTKLSKKFWAGRHALICSYVTQNN